MGTHERLARVDRRDFPDVIVVEAGAKPGGSPGQRAQFARSGGPGCSENLAASEC
jgi:hypothetical protein